MPSEVPAVKVGKQTLYTGGDGRLRCKPCHNGLGDRQHKQRGQHGKDTVCQGGSCECLCGTAVTRRRPKAEKPEPQITVARFGGVTFGAPGRS